MDSKAYRSIRFFEVLKGERKLNPQTDSKRHTPLHSWKIQPSSTWHLVEVLTD